MTVSRNRVLCALLLAFSLSSLCFAQSPPPPARDTMPDTWAVTDALGRTAPGFEEAGPPRRDRFVAMFYFLWLGAHEKGGPYDITKILRQDPDAMGKPDSPLWGPMFAPHHWGESVFGYYRTDDEWVLRKHAQMLTDAGVDAIVFDVTNQFTYRHEYRALLKVFSEVRRDGGRAPQVAFLCPFWRPRKVVLELWEDLYGKGDYRDFWFEWDGKPLILADPALLGESIGEAAHDSVEPLRAGRPQGQTFTAAKPVARVSGTFATWKTNDAAVTLTLRRGGPKGEALLAKRFTNVTDNATLELTPETPLPPGVYHLEASEPKGKTGWWRKSDSRFKAGSATLDGAEIPGARVFRVDLEDEATRPIREFFTFRKPQPDYFRGPEKPDMWSWLEVAPQHVFMNSRGEKEQMSVGVAQNAVDGRLGSLSEPGARGRSFHDGAPDTRPDAVRHGFNFAEQWARARAEDPQIVFVTGWNEWIAGRHPEFGGVKLPVMFVDQFDQEHSRDIEPMKGGHGDDYYYQFVSEVRKYRGTRPAPVSRNPKSIDIGGDFSQWDEVDTVYLDDAGDTAHRDHPGYAGHARYVDRSGRNDIIMSKVAWDAERVFFHVRTREPLTDSTGPEWMILYLDADRNPATGWHGYDWRVNRPGSRPELARVERWDAAAGKWEDALEAPRAWRGSDLHLALPRTLFPLREDGGLAFDFKWADNLPAAAGASGFLTGGDVAPNGRFNYRFLTGK